MNMHFFSSQYKAVFESDDFPITVSKENKSGWCEISTDRNGHKEEITIRSQQDLEHLHFCIGQLLKLAER